MREYFFLKNLSINFCWTLFDLARSDEDEE